VLHHQAARARELNGLIAKRDLFLLEDAHGWDIDKTPATLTRGRERWAVVRTVSRLPGPNLRLAFEAGDAQTIARVEARQAITTARVSRLLQGVVAELLGSAQIRRRFHRAETEADRRREAVLSALAGAGVRAHGASSLFTWIPLRGEAFAMR
jgi:DNA-binding transcriptional MocR family regulator